ncbi:MAG: 2-oxoglutarate dehydrogenase complex dihydrolipoyllysine-residue succinyltransferase [Alphaproteobacteria bacterium]|nr:2-oxoglutarate dehydrogenase complex dihydrolipoyllysine-residue succinyltransferase [Alphaproteobacteria bacterium]
MASTAVDILVPTLGESVTEATIAKWKKAVGEAVAADEVIVELETDKITMEVNAAASGVLTSITMPEGATVAVGQVIGAIDPAASATASASTTASANANANASSAPAAAAAAGSVLAMPSAAKLASEQGIDTASLAGTGKDGRVTKGDVLQAAATPAPAPIIASASAPAPTPRPVLAGVTSDGRPREERVKMTKLRQKIAERLKMAQNTAAMLTTFNEVDMGAVMAARAKYKDSFEKRFGVRLGFMSFFVKACVEALREFSSVNAEISGDEIIYKNYYDIGIAVGGGQGLVVPVVRDCDALNFAEIERRITDFGLRAREGKLSVDELSGGTFTITNGGLYGSLMSTPIINPPQSAILGMHKIMERAMVVNGQVVARPMMYLALSYDHRVIDGREAVSFLVRVKEFLEDPQSLLLML